MQFSRLFWKLFFLNLSLNLLLTTGFFVIYRAPQAEIDNRSSTSRVWLLSVVALTIGTGCSYAISRGIARPLELLAAQARTVAAGETSEPVRIPSDHDLGVLAAAFNQMQSAVASRERDLSKINRQNATVLGGMDEGIVAVDRAENILLVNKSGRRMLNISRDEVVGKPLLEAVRSRPLYETFKDCLHRQEAVQTDIEPSGRATGYLSVSAACLPGDPVPGVVMVLRDTTELRRLENLRQEFVANVNHELKTPLASIKAYAETLRLGAIDDQENNVRFVGRIEEQAERLDRLIHDMLQIARVETGKVAFDITRVSVDNVIRASVRAHLQSAAKKQIELLVVPPGQPVNANADEEGLRTIVDNLINNAIKYTPGRGIVTVRSGDDGCFAWVEVEDTGIGIAQSHQSRVFERFYRVDKARSRELGGTGLGLSIVKHLCQAFGGSVTLHSTPGCGSVFKVALPHR